MTPKQKQYRNRLIGTIHATAKSLGLSEDVRRDVMVMVVGCDSCSDMDIAQLKTVADHLRGQQGKAPTTTPNRRYRPTNTRPEIRILYGKWSELHALGATCGTPVGLDKWVSRTFTVSSTEWLNGEQARTACEMLKQWIARVTVANRKSGGDDITGRSKRGGRKK